MTTAAINNQTMKYSLQNFKEVIFYGFDFVVPKAPVDIMNYLSTEIGSSCITAPVFQKIEYNEGETMLSASSSNNKNKNRKYNY